MNIYMCVYGILRYFCEYTFYIQGYIVFFYLMDKFGFKKFKLCFQYENYRMKNGNWYVYFNNLRGGRGIRGLKENGRIQGFFYGFGFFQVLR